MGGVLHADGQDRAALADALVQAEVARCQIIMLLAADRALIGRDRDFAVAGGAVDLGMDGGALLLLLLLQAASVEILEHHVDAGDDLQRGDDDPCRRADHDAVNKGAGDGQIVTPASRL